MVITGNLLLGSDDDYFVGNGVIDSARLGQPDKKVAMTKHPLHDLFSYTQKPSRGAYQKFRHTLNDIVAISAKKISVQVMEKLEGLDGKSPEEMKIVHQYILNLQSGTCRKANEFPEAEGSNSGPPVGEGGLSLVYENVISILSALINLYEDTMDDNNQPVILTKDAYEKKHHYLVTSTAQLSSFLFFGPASFWTCPQN